MNIVIISIAGPLLLAALAWFIFSNISFERAWATIQPITIGAGGTPTVGTILFVGNLGSPQVYNPIGNLGNMKWDLKNKNASTTNQGTAWEQSIPTLSDAGTLTADVLFMPGSQGQDGQSGVEGHSFSSGLGYIFQNRQTRSWKLVYPDGTAEVFNAYITNFPIDMSVEKALMLNVQFTLTGQPVLI